MCVAQPVDQRLLLTILDDEDQEGHAVRVVLAKAEPLRKLGAEVGPPRVIFDKLKRRGKVLVSCVLSQASVGLRPTPHLHSQACLQTDSRDWHPLCHLGDESVHADDALEPPRVGVE